MTHFQLPPEKQAAVMIVEKTVGLGKQVCFAVAAIALAPFVEEMRKVPGFPLMSRSRITVLGEPHETVATVTRVKVGPHAASLFEPPAGYALVAPDAPDDDEEEDE